MFCDPAVILSIFHSFNSVLALHSKVSIIRPGRSRLLEFEKKIVMVV